MQGPVSCIVLGVQTHSTPESLDRSQLSVAAPAVSWRGKESEMLPASHTRRQGCAFCRRHSQATIEVVWKTSSRQRGWTSGLAHPPPSLPAVSGRTAASESSPSVKCWLRTRQVWVNGAQGVTLSARVSRAGHSASRASCLPGGCRGLERARCPERAGGSPDARSHLSSNVPDKSWLCLWAARGCRWERGREGRAGAVRRRPARVEPLGAQARPAFVLTWARTSGAAATSPLRLEGRGGGGAWTWEGRGLGV